MEPGQIVRIASLYKSTENNDQVEECRNLYKGMKSSSQSIPDLMNIYVQIEDPKAHLMILDIIYYRIRNYWFEISDEIKSSILPFFYEGITAEQVSKYIDNKNDDVLSLLSKCQALLASYYYPSDFPCWDFVKNFKDKHYCFFVSNFFTVVAVPNFETLPHFLQIKAAMEPSADKEIFEKITNIIQSSDSDLVKYGYLAFSRYTMWGTNFNNLIENKDFFLFVLESKKIPYVVELINNVIIRLNIDCEDFIQNVPLEEIVGYSKELLNGLNNNSIQNSKQSWEYIRKTAILINTIIVTLDHNPQLLQQLNAIQYLTDFISIQDFETTMILIPSLTYLIQNANEDSDIISSILGRISIYYNKQKNDPYMEIDHLVPNLCNAMSKANQDMVGEFLKAMLDDQNFQNDPNFASAVLASLSYSSLIPISTKFEIFHKLEELYHQPLMPENFPLYFRCYYLIFFLAKLYIPPQQNEEANQSQEQQQQIQEMNEQSKSVISSIFKIVTEDLFNPNNLGVITNKENFDYQFLKPVRKIVSKMRALKQNFDPEFVGFVGSELVKLEQCPEEAAKIIACLINEDSFDILVQILESLNENIQNTKNISYIDFALTLISNLKFVKLNENICKELSSNLDTIHKIISELKYDKLIGLLYKAYAIVVPHVNIMNIAPELMELISDKYSLGCSFCLVDAILNSEHGSEFTIIQDYISNSTGFLTNNVLVLPPTPDDEQFFKETSKYYCSFLKTFFEKNKKDLENIFPQMGDILPRQLEVGFKHSYFIERVTDALIALHKCGVPAGPMVNFLIPSLSFLFNPSFNPAYAQHQRVLETALKFHTLLIKGSLDSFKPKFEEFLAMIGASQRTQELAKGNYYQICQEADLNNLQSLYQNDFFTVFYNSILSDIKSNNFPPQQAQS